MVCEPDFAPPALRWGEQHCGLRQTWEVLLRLQGQAHPFFMQTGIFLFYRGALGFFLFYQETYLVYIYVIAKYPFATTRRSNSTNEQHKSHFSPR